jgi:hypothetical protein
MVRPAASPLVASRARPDWALVGPSPVRPHPGGRLPPRSEPWSEEMLLRQIKEDAALDRRAQQWLESHGPGRSDSIVGDPDLRRKVRRIESRDRRRAKIDQERANQGLPPRKWR